MNLRRRFIGPLFAEVDASALIVFRVMFGLIMLVECWRFWSKGWIKRHYINPDYFASEPAQEEIGQCIAEAGYTPTVVAGEASSCSATLARVVRDTCYEHGS